MSALSHPFCNILGGSAENGAYREALFSPKARSCVRITPGAA
jgi:hypothetical protein